jgi:DNA-binding Lrp family transcriptional regulator
MLHSLSMIGKVCAMPLDQLDGRILELFASEPRVGVLEASRRLGVARGTVQSRLDRLVREGVIRGFGPELDPGAMGYPVTAFCSLEIRQGLGHSAVARHLAAIPAVLEAHTLPGSGDLLVRVVARSNADLQRVIDQVVDDEHVLRTSTLIALDLQVPHRVLPLLRSAVAQP